MITDCNFESHGHRKTTWDLILAWIHVANNVDYFKAWVQIPCLAVWGLDSLRNLFENTGNYSNNQIFDDCDPIIWLSMVPVPESGLQCPASERGTNRHLYKEEHRKFHQWTSSEVHYSRLRTFISYFRVFHTHFLAKSLIRHEIAHSYVCFLTNCRRFQNTYRIKLNWCSDVTVKSWWVCGEIFIPPK